MINDQGSSFRYQESVWILSIAYQKLCMSIKDQGWRPRDQCTRIENQKLVTMDLGSELETKEQWLISNDQGLITKSQWP